MKKRLMTTTTLFLSLASASAFAHHPAADIVDPEIYAMIDENVADTPHADLTFDDMGRPTDDVTDSGMGQASEDAVAETNAGETMNRMEQEAALNDDATDTIDLIENVNPQLAQGSDELVSD
jgi:hypothetical protein